MLPRPERNLSKEPLVSSLTLAASAVAVLGAGLLMAIAYYTEAHAAPDQS